MKLIDVILALVSGRIIAFLLQDLLKELGISSGFYVFLIVWLGFPLFSLFCLWISYLIGKKFLFVYQMAKFLLVGAVATIVDLKVFELFYWLISYFISVSLLFPKGISFLIATFLKYWGNKHWAFLKHEKENIKKEVTQFFFVTVIGMVIDIVAFYVFVNIVGPQYGVSETFWVKISVIFAGIVAAVWNFAGYKFWVFKK
ncbi:MAG: hypothetical protein A3D35_00750 [Candidatus Staskawiczbacteria bacterium RIFCSPHIGHO2_02_FULL_34_9]|uniref:GtrA/DPMS transmembrane domain-containing protein n=1 Tax=Candidatus Staskawiczbacteria bacterium RIFCSPHIGHO2_02_FULL_34_9 TaxID=1802206 RepID=A0A1G2HXV5_9BACT|nr:MAG: hypothetical protein A3D35_00750 [Candidatus Staskawiczbacteria bacterium RIFCSPHIGHO2_02_FULL_34_9]